MTAGRRYLIIPVLLCTAGFWGLTGCAAYPAMSERPVQMSESSYNAADMLAQQFKGVMTPGMKLKVGTLADMNAPGEATPFGRLVADQIAARFVQLGYHVSSVLPADMAAAQPMPPAGGTMASAPIAYSPDLRPDAASLEQAALITGQYVVARREVLVNLRIAEWGTGRVLAAYDYSLPLTGNLEALTRTSRDEQASSGFFSL